MFAKGFLLTKLILENKSECGVPPVDDCISHVSQFEGCWHPKIFNKAVVIIIDALRYDFTVPHEATANETEPKFFHNAFEVLYETARSRPENAFLLPFIADPPTTTLQRLKGLTTGTLPTFIDAGSNFAGTAIEEDNLLAQLREAGNILVHLGDDTWHSLFPEYFEASLTHAYDSFNVWDLHTVDDGVIEHLVPLLQSPNASSWDVIFGHLLGVDHAGHRYGPDHMAMWEKLKQMDDMIRNVMQLIEDDTLLVVMGDHGMDTKGDHGGESDEEVEAALWMYSKQPAFGRTQPSFVEPPRTAKERPVRQIDLVPTLSLLLGVPIPFNNLGSPIEEAFAGVEGNNWGNLAQVNYLSAGQIQRYQAEYSVARDLHISDQQIQLQSRVRQASLELRTSSEPGPTSWESLYQACREMQRETLIVYRGLWANFNIPAMLHGVEILLAVLGVHLVYARSFQGDRAYLLPAILRNIGLGSVAGASLGASSGSVSEMDFLSGGLYGVGMGGALAPWLSFYQFRNQLLRLLPTSLFGWLALLFAASQAIGFASNSYTIHEDSILLFFLTTFGVLAGVSSCRRFSSSDRMLGTYYSALFVLLTRVASFSRMCREEQMPNCRSTFYASSASSTSAPWQLFIPYVVAIVLPEIIKAFYRGTASYKGSAGFWIGFCFRVGLLLIALVWTIDAADNAGWFSTTFTPTTLKTIGITIARCVLAIALVAGAATMIWAKPCLNIYTCESTSIAEQVAPTPQADAPNKIHVISPPAASPTKETPQIIIFGYTNVHGTRYFLIIPAFILAIALVLPPMGQFSLAICCWQILCLLEVLDTNSLTIGGAKAGSAIGPVLLAMLGSYHFFKTGHQAVLSSIQWNAAFIPLRTIRYPWSPLLVTLNTFGAQILCAMAVPLIVLWKRPARNRSTAVSAAVVGDILQAIMTHLLYYATIHLATTMWAGHLRRHLMLYRVFMPRYLMASVVLAVIELVVIAFAWGGVWVTELSVTEVFGF